MEGIEKGLIYQQGKYPSAVLSDNSSLSLESNYLKFKWYIEIPGNFNSNGKMNCMQCFQIILGIQLRLDL